MTPVDERKSTFLTFWTTLPGIFTALAAVLTAAGGIYVAMPKHQGDLPGPDARTMTINLFEAPGIAPSVSDVSAGQLELSTVDSGSSQDDDTLVSSAVEECAGGNDDACTTLLDLL